MKVEYKKCIKFVIKQFYDRMEEILKNSCFFFFRVLKNSVKKKKIQLLQSNRLIYFFKVKKEKLFFNLNNDYLY